MQDSTIAIRETFQTINYEKDNYYKMNEITTQSNWKFNSNPNNEVNLTTTIIGDITT